ncbi:Hpt domain-containing protein [Nonlabens ulvanivorans]|uniref:Hpt domain-containing protein n=1 Tax=Nonlabens ulvanivorans TaxID=906888 RepID=UPI0037CA1084
MSEFLELETLKDNFGDDVETFVQILDIFLHEVPVDYQLLKKQIETKDYENAGEIAHKIKSSYRLLDMEMETMLLQEIENRAKAVQDTDEIITLYEQFQANYDTGIDMVQQTRDAFASKS